MANRILFLIAFLGAAWGITGNNAGAQQVFAGIKLDPTPAAYLILKDVNIRALPKTKSKRIGRFSKGSRVAVAGRAKGTEWLAVRKDGKIVGFIFAKAMAAIIDGRLVSDLSGEAPALDSGKCRYSVHFTGKNKVRDEPLVTADYVLRFRCRRGGKALNFGGLMFITEIPYRNSLKDVYQINIDLTEMPDAVGEPLTAIIMYHRRKGKIVFDSLSETGLKSAKTIATKPAKTVPEALTGAVEIAVSAWGSKVWARLSQ